MIILCLNGNHQSTFLHTQLLQILPLSHYCYLLLIVLLNQLVNQFLILIYTSIVKYAHRSQECQEISLMCLVLILQQVQEEHQQIIAIILILLQLHLLLLWLKEFHFLVIEINHNIGRQSVQYDWIVGYYGNQTSNGFWYVFSMISEIVHQFKCVQFILGIVLTYRCQ